MAKQAKYNLSVSDPKTGEIHSFEQGKVYPDSAITDAIDESNFLNVSDAALDEQAEEEATVKKTARKGKKVEEL